MKILSSIFLVALFACCAFVAEGQNVATASISANVIVPIGMVKTTDMSFGNAAVSSVAGGSIVLTPASSRTSAAGVTLPATAGTVAAAAFTVSGAPTYSYSISLPSSVTISSPGAASMTVNGFNSLPSSTGTLSVAGTQTLAVGATLNIAAAQAPGLYANATAVPVTVNYN